MKGCIVFYSFSGKTRKCCLFLKEKVRGEEVFLDLLEIKPQKEENSFWKQAMSAFFHREVALKKVKFDLSEYNFVIFACGVWAATITPALRSYLGKVTGLEGKKGACFLTYGSGLGSGKALKELKSILERKGVRIVFAKAIKSNKINDEGFLWEVFLPLKRIINAPVA